MTVSVSVITVGTAVESAIISSPGLGLAPRFSISIGFGNGISFGLGFGISGPLASVVSVSTAVVSTITTVSTVAIVSTVGFRLRLGKSAGQSGEKGDYSKQE